MRLYKLTHDFVNQRFLAKLANTPDKIRVSLADNSILKKMFLKFSSIIGFFSFDLKKLISSRFCIQRFAIATISLLDADLTLFDFLKEDAFELIILDRY